MIGFKSYRLKKRKEKKKKKPLKHNKDAFSPCMLAHVGKHGRHHEQIKPQASNWRAEHRRLTRH